MKRLLLGMLLLLLVSTVIAQRDDLQRVIDDINARLGLNLQEGDYLWQGVTQNYDGNNLGCPYVESTQSGTFRGTQLRVDLHFDQVYEWDYRVSEDGSIFILCLPPDEPSPTFVTPTPAICGLPTQLSIGAIGQVPVNAIPSNLRDQPGQSGNLLAEIPPGGTFTILDGPRCSLPSFTWWQVDYNGTIGWVAESGNGEYYLQLPGDETQLQPTPTETETPVETLSDCSDAPPTRISIGQRGRVEIGGLPNNVRSRAGSTNTDIGDIPPGGEFVVLDGPSCADGMFWWLVDHNGLIGWTVEGANGEYWIEPTGSAPIPTPGIAAQALAVPTEVLICPPAPPPRLVVGEQGRVEPDGFPNNVRANFGQSSDYLGEIPPSGEFTVLDGPICASGLFWWQVDHNGLIGWTAEGSEDDYWLEPLVLPMETITTTLDVDCPIDAPTPQYTVDDRVRLNEVVTLYDKTDLSGARLGRMPIGGEFIVDAGPFCTVDARLHWWKVNYNGTIGYVADNWDTPMPMFIADENTPSVCGDTDTNPPRLLMGGRGRYAIPVMSHVAYVEMNESSDSRLIPIDATFDVLDQEPQCVDDTLWWRIEFESEQLWMFEATEFGYRVEPLPAIANPLFIPVQLGDITPLNTSSSVRKLWLGNNLNRLDYMTWDSTGSYVSNDEHNPANNVISYGPPLLSTSNYIDVVRWRGRTIGVYLDESRTQLIFRLVSSGRLLALELPQPQPEYFTINPGDLTVVAINESNQLLQWDVQPYLEDATNISSDESLFVVPISRQVNTPHAEEISALSIQFGAGGNRMVMQSIDLITVWDVATWRPIALFPYNAGAFNRNVARIALNQDGTLLAMAGVMNSPYLRLARSFVEVYDVQTGQLINRMTAEERGDFLLEDLLITPDSRYVMTTGGAWAAGQQGGAVWVWEIESGQVVANWYPHGVEDVSSIAISPDMGYMATTSGSLIRLWRLDY